MSLLMNKTIDSSYFIEINISSQLTENSLFVNFQKLPFVTGVLSRKRRATNNSTCMLNSLGEGEMTMKWYTGG